MSTDKLINRHYSHNLGELVDGLAQFVANHLSRALTIRNHASLVLPGGKTPNAFLPQLSQLNLPWQSIYLTLSDERWVETTEADSNEKQLREFFLQQMAIKPHFIPLKTAHTHPVEAIETIDIRLVTMPQPFDLVILGMGEDGHIASLFPGMPLDEHDAQLCQSAAPPVAPSLRISLSFRSLVESRQIVFVILGKSKRQRLDQLITSTNTDIPFVKLLQHQSVTIFESDAEPITKP